MRRILIVTLASAVLAGGGLVAAWSLSGAPPRQSVAEGEALIGGPFELTDQQGARVSEKDFAGRYMLVFFGFTYCPDMCPLTLATMSAALDALSPAEAERVVPVFITLDPERDGVEEMREYAALFDPRLVALTGARGEIDAAARAYRVYHARAGDGDDGTYLIDHSAFTYLMGPDGRYVAHFSYDVGADEMAERLRDQLRQG